MKIISKEEMRQCPVGTFFIDNPHMKRYEIVEDIQIKTGESFGAASLITPPDYLDPFEWDWNLDEYKDDEQFGIFTFEEVVAEMTRYLNTRIYGLVIEQLKAKELM